MSTKTDQDPPPTTFKDVQPSPRCPDCGGAPVFETGGEMKCKSGHTWIPSERTLKL